jgi:hypothetical protein
MPAGKGRYTIGAKGTHGCKGYPVVGGEGKVHGCHATEAEARAQQAAIYASEASQKADGCSPESPDCGSSMCKVCADKTEKSDFWAGTAFGKKDYTAEQRRQMASRGQAMEDGSFPIANAKDLANAIRSIGRASNPAAAKKHIISRARALDMLDMIPEEWNK